ncbi:MAG: alpha/beta fold hydrolase [Candidatus Lokiarchaeota archaeon]|nr:alpha/beta fold hydrolase [Candidatus Lokiarchaeota archaeon]MBD3342119.1 alpha/beta fold hydrolase [Candidatus Lokiarchaeota archaeon]
MINIPICKTDDVELFYIMEGRGEPLVLIQGTNTKWQAGHFQIEFFHEKMQVIAYDLRGSGKSSRPDYHYTMDMFVEDLNALLNCLEIKEKVHLCGVSLGGAIALKFVLKYPEKVKSMILLGTLTYSDPQRFKQTLNLYKNNFPKMTIEQRFQLIFKLEFTGKFQRRVKKDPELYDMLRKDVNFIAYIVDPPEIKDYVNQWESLRNYDVRDRLSQIQQPTLIALGNLDKNISPAVSESMHKSIPNSELKIFDNMTHGFTIENHQEVNNLIWEFLKKHI